MTIPTSFHISTAVKAASDSVLYRFKHGAVIYDKSGKIISTGRNISHYRPGLKKYGYKSLFLHAESDAILKTNIECLKGANLLVVRVGKHKLCNSKPCKHCLGLILQTGIKHVYYSDVSGEIEKLF